MSEQPSDSLLRALKAECNLFVHGTCTTLSCLKRDAGGIRAQLPIELVGCTEYRAVIEIEAHRRLRDRVAALKNCDTKSSMIDYEMGRCIASLFAELDAQGDGK